MTFMIGHNPNSLADLTALILCGGLGTRLRAAVPALPKVLAPIAGRSFIDYQLSYLRDQGITDVILCTGHQANHVEKHCGKGEKWNLRIRYSRETMPLGTAGAIKHAAKLGLSEPSLVLNGDSFAAVDLGRLIHFHRERRPWATLALVEVLDKANFGAVSLGEDGVIRAFGEKGVVGPGLINAGVYVLSEAVVEIIAVGPAVSLEREIFPPMTDGRMLGVPQAVPFLDIGTVESYAQAPEFLAQWSIRKAI